MRRYIMAAEHVIVTEELGTITSTFGHVEGAMQEHVDRQGYRGEQDARSDSDTTDAP